jgi:hypothetical protein
VLKYYGILKYIDFGILYTGTVPDTGNDYKLSKQLLKNLLSYDNLNCFEDVDTFQYLCAKIYVGHVYVAFKSLKRC